MRIFTLPPFRERERFLPVRTSMNGNAAESQKYIIYMADCENQGEELQRLLGTEFPDGSDASGEISYEEVARKNMWTIYEICSVK